MRRKRPGVIPWTLLNTRFRAVFIMHTTPLLPFYLRSPPRIPLKRCLFLPLLASRKLRSFPPSAKVRRTIYPFLHLRNGPIELLFTQGVMAIELRPHLLKKARVHTPEAPLTLLCPVLVTTKRPGQRSPRHPTAPLKVTTLLTLWSLQKVRPGPQVI